MFSATRKLTFALLSLLLAANFAWAQSTDTGGEGKAGDDPAGDPVPPTANFGPDNFGNVGYDDSTDHCEYDFIDISGTGTQIASGDDVLSSQVVLPAAFNLYGTDYTSLWANTNGVIGTAGNFGSDFTNDCPLPASPSGSGARIYPLHDDYISEVYYQYFATCPRASAFGDEGCHVFQWFSDHFGIEGDRDFTFEAVLYAESYSMAFQHGEGNVETGSGSTTGIQNAAVNDALVYACDSAGSIPAGSAQCIYHPSALPFTLPQQAAFQVSKSFNDGNPGEVEVTLTCNTGLPLQQQDTISEGDNVTFVVGDFEDGQMDCEVTETDGLAGYSVTYDAIGQAANDEACVFEDVALQSRNICDITNTLDQVEVEVTKEWIDENPQFAAVNIAEANWECENVASGAWYGYLDFFGSDDTQSFFVYPDWDGGTECSVTEVSLPESGVETDDSDCQGIELFPGDTAACTIVNTRLYEGIPTLSQYGLALLALMMLGMGFVAFRRIA